VAPWAGFGMWYAWYGKNPNFLSSYICFYIESLVICHTSIPHLLYVLFFLNLFQNIVGTKGENLKIYNI
jgi:hypothetical protein